MQTRGLTLIESLIAFGVVADENLAEGRIESLDMGREVLAVLKLELFLPALFGRARRCETVCRGIAQNSGAKLFINENAGLLFWNSGIDGCLTAVVDHLLRLSYFVCLRSRHGFMPSEHLELE